MKKFTIFLLIGVLPLIFMFLSHEGYEDTGGFFVMVNTITGSGCRYQPSGLDPEPIACSENAKTNFPRKGPFPIRWRLLSQEESWAQMDAQRAKLYDNGREDELRDGFIKCGRYPCAD